MTQILALRLLSLFLVLMISACGQQDPESRLQNARQHFQQDHSAIAILELKQSLSENPDHLASVYLLNEIYASQYDYENIRLLLKSAIDRGVDDQGVYQSYVDALIHLAEFSLSENVLNAKPEYFTNAQGLALNGHLYAGKNNPDQAIRFYKQALELDAALISAHLGLAQEAVIQAGRNTDQQPLTQSVSISENSWVQPSTTRNDAIQKEKSPLVLAEEHLDYVFSKNKNNLIAYYLKASIAYIRHDTAVALDYLKTALHLSPNHAESLLLTGRIYLESGHLDRSAEYLSRYLKINENDLTASIYLASIALRQKQAQIALDLLKKFEITGQENIEFLLVIGNAHLYLQDAVQAVGFFKKAQALLPDAALTNMYLAMGLLANDQAKDAIVTLRKVLKAEPENEQAGISLVTTLIQLQEYAQAETAVADLRRYHPKTPMPHYMAGLIYSALDKHDLAISAFNDALKQKHGFIPASLRLARLYRERDQLDKAIEIYNAALFSSPYHPDVLTEMAASYANDGNQDKSIELLELARDRNATALTARLILGRYYLRRAQINEAEKIVNELIKIGSTRSDVKMFMAQTFLSTGRVKESLNLYEELVRIEPDSPELLTRYASALIKAGHTAQGRKTLSVAREIKGQASLDTLLTLGELELREDNFSEALLIAEEIMTTYSSMSAGYLLQGDILMKQKKPADAAIVYEKALILADQSQTVLKLSEALIQSGQTESSRVLLKRSVAKHKDDVRIGLMLANIQQAEGKSEAVIDTYLLMLDQFPNNALILNNLAWLYAESDLQKSFDFAKRAYQVTPELPEIADTYGWFCILSGRYDEGIDLIKSAISKAPENAEFHYHLAEAFAKAGKHDSARESLQVALASGKSFSERGKAEALLIELEKIN